MINHAINSVVAATAKRAASLCGGTAKAHAQKQIDDKALKKLWRRGADAIKQILRKGKLDLPVCRQHNLVGWLRGHFAGNYMFRLVLIVRCPLG